MNFDTGNNEVGMYKVEAIRDSAVYAKESAGHLLEVYYLLSWKSYPEEENTWEPALTIQHFRKFISSFHKNYPDKSTTTSLAIDTAPPIARLTIWTINKPTKRKQDHPTKEASKHAAKSGVARKKKWQISILTLCRPCLHLLKERWFSSLSHPIRLGGFLSTDPYKSQTIA